MNQNQNQSTRRYAEVAAGGSDNQRWEPTKNMNTPNYPMQIEGYFKSFKELPGTNGPFMVAEIQMVNTDGSFAQCVDVSGGKVLEEKLSSIPLGSFIMIQFKGKVQGKKNAYNDWATFIDEGAIPLHQIMGTPAPVQQQSAPNPFAAPAQQAAPVQQQVSNPFSNVQQAAPNQFGNAPTQQNTAAPVFQQASVPAQQAVNPANPFGNAPGTFQQSAPAQANPFGNGQAQGNGQFAGMQGQPNPFANENNDLPFK